MARDPLMSTAKKMYKPGGAKKSKGMHRPEGAGNFDNMDDYNIVKSVNCNELKVNDLKLRGVTPGSVLFVDSDGNIGEDNSNFFWDDTNNRLGIGTDTPTGALHLKEPSTEIVTRLFWEKPNSTDKINYQLQDAGNFIVRYIPSGTAYNPFSIFSLDANPSVVFADSSGIYAQIHSNGNSYFNGGNVGIGTDSPSDKIDIAGGIRVTLNLAFDASKGGRMYKSFEHGLAFHGIPGTQNDFAFFESGGQLMFTNPVGTNTLSLVPTATGGKVGIGTTTPTQILSVKEKVCMTAIGGFAIKLTNTTGVNTIQGQTVKADPATNDAVILTAADDTECMGVFLESGVADDAEAWVVVAGIADVAMGDNELASRGAWVETNSGEAGYADATSASPAAAPQHFNEIGHCIESVAAGGGGTHILARCVLHFN